MYISFIAMLVFSRAKWSRGSTISKYTVKIGKKGFNFKGN